MLSMSNPPGVFFFMAILLAGGGIAMCATAEGAADVLSALSLFCCSFGLGVLAFRFERWRITVGSLIVALWHWVIALLIASVG